MGPDFSVHDTLGDGGVGIDHTCGGGDIVGFKDDESQGRKVLGAAEEDELVRGMGALAVGEVSADDRALMVGGIEWKCGTAGGEQAEELGP